MPTSQEWLKTIDRVRFNPADIQRVALENLTMVTNGTVDITDPTNPFVFLLEAAAVNAAAAMVANEANTRKLYPSMALDSEELYLHMSDVDYIGRFASPARTTISFLLQKDETISRVVPTGVGSIRKLTIPRNTEITVADVSFTMQYPIDIRIMAHGGFQVVYDTDQLSPLQNLESNLVDWTIVNIQGQEFLKIDVPVSQFKIQSEITKINLSTGLDKTFSFQDQFYYARAFYSSNGVWKEMLTTHTDQVFDPLKPTLALKVVDSQLRVTLPQVYLATGLLNSEIRVDIYTTRGPLDMLLDNYAMNAFTVRWVDLDLSNTNAPLSIFSAPLTNFTTKSVYSTSTVNGGSNALTFEQLRERVIMNSLGSRSVPITNAQLTSRLSDLGYDLVADVDNVTNRQFKATRSLPRPTDASVITGAGCTIQTLSATMETLAGLPTAKDNGNRVTLLPDTVYRNVGGILEVVPQFVINGLLAQPVDIRARQINDSRYMYSPFHYVLDMNNNRFDSRAYYLDAPIVESKSFVEENDTTGISVAVDNYRLERNAQGYRLLVFLRSGPAWKALANSDVVCQLSYRPVNERDRAYQNGILIGQSVTGERVYAFDIETNYDIDERDNIVLTSFSMYQNLERKHPTPLVTDFDIVLGATGLTEPGITTSSIDQVINQALVQEGTIGITRERVRIRLGSSLKGLWSASRSVVSSEDYDRYLTDVPALYESTVYARDPVTGALLITSDGNGGIDYVVLHAKNDPVLDANDDPVYRFRAGDIKVDQDGRPIVLSTRKLMRQMDLFLLDGVYWFATESTAISYRATLPATVVGWLDNDIAQSTNYLLEQTELFFFPKSTLGQIRALVLENQEITLPAEQSFEVTYYMSGTQYRDSALRQSLSRMAIETINEVLQNRTVTMSEMTSKLRAKAGNDIISVDIRGLGGTTPLSTITLLDDSARLSIRKKATAEADGTVGVEDDVSVSFIQHTEI